MTLPSWLNHCHFNREISFHILFISQGGLGPPGDPGIPGPLVSMIIFNLCTDYSRFFPFHFNKFHEFELLSNNNDVVSCKDITCTCFNGNYLVVLVVATISDKPVATTNF